MPEPLITALCPIQARTFAQGQRGSQGLLVQMVFLLAPTLVKDTQVCAQIVFKAERRSTKATLVPRQEPERSSRKSGRGERI